MTKALLLAAGLALLASPARARVLRDQATPSSYADRRDRERGSWREHDGWHDDERGGSGRGAPFMIRNGDAVVAVRCDGSEPMRVCVHATLTLPGAEFVRCRPHRPQAPLPAHRSRRGKYARTGNLVRAT